MSLIKTTQKKYTGAFGATEVAFTPKAQRKLEFDVRNCPHCGVHHASLDGELRADGRVIVRCPALGGKPIELIVKLFLHVP
jgi:hypothetical protein